MVRSFAHMPLGISDRNSSIDTQECQLVSAVSQQLLSTNASCAKTIVGRYSEKNGSWGIRFEKNV